MPRYIDADELIKGRVSNDPVVIAAGVEPTANVQEVRHGKWVLYKPRRENRNATYKCSECKKVCSSYYNDVGGWNYCPHCGAKMDGGEEE